MRRLTTNLITVLLAAPRAEGRISLHLLSARSRFCRPRGHPARCCLKCGDRAAAERTRITETDGLEKRGDGTGRGSTPPALPSKAGAMEEQEQTPPFPQDRRDVGGNFTAHHQWDPISFPKGYDFNPSNAQTRAVPEPDPRDGLAGDAAGLGVLPAAPTPFPSRHGQKCIPRWRQILHHFCPF